MTLFLYNTLTRKKEEFRPHDPRNVRMYVCGPTVYGRAHLGNARSVVVYDVLYRLLRHVYGSEHVTYARNITDVDDKINAAAIERGITIQALTKEVTQWFHDDMGTLNVIPSSDNKSNGIMIEPKATDHIRQMVQIIERLIKNNHAYVAQGHVLFSVKSMPEYGALSGRIQDDLEAGARVKVEGYKRDPGDFVLWKPTDAQDDPSSVFDSPWGNGRPGWHIECSAMSHTHLGDDFDIHGGGSDLMFPHHENEIAQSRSAFPGSTHAKYWVHNGFLTVNGDKMSKSLGNFITVKDLLDKGVKGEVIRYALLKTKYNEPLDWNEKLLSDAKKNLDYLYRALASVDVSRGAQLNTHTHPRNNEDYYKSQIEPLQDDLNTPLFFANLAEIANGCIIHPSTDLGARFGYDLKFLAGLFGFLQHDPKQWFQGGADNSGNDAATQSLIDARIAAKKAKNWAEADRIRGELKAQGILLEDRPDGTTDWRRE